VAAAITFAHFVGVISLMRLWNCLLYRGTPTSSVDDDASAVSDLMSPSHPVQWDWPEVDECLLSVT